VKLKQYCCGNCCNG